jgi:uncharacterized protein (TIGR00297 family)
MPNELRRKAVHVSMIAWALLIGRLEPWTVNTICFLALLFNVFLLRRVTGGTLERAPERERGYSVGLLAYPAVLLGIGLWWREMHIVMAIAWGAMAFGDGFASVIGTTISSKPLPWNARKTWSGFWGFCIVGFTLTWLFAMLCLPVELRNNTLQGASMLTWTLIIGASILAGAVAESIDGFVDDNISVPLVAAFTAWFGIAFVREVTVHGLPTLPSDWLYGFAGVTVFAVASVLARKIDIPGSVAGWCCAFAIFLGGSWTGLGLLFLFFAAGSVASSWRASEKRALGVEQENRGVRSVVHALANAGVAAVCGFLAWSLPQYEKSSFADVCRIILAASLAAATSDTFSSEFGNVYGKRFVNILTLKPDTRGLDGVVSLEGLLFGVLGSACVAGLFAIGMGWSLSVAIIFLAGIAANLLDSVLGASLQRVGLMNNHSVNFAATLAGALVAYALVFVVVALTYVRF